MDQSTIQQLNAFNHSFYTEYAESFSKTRAYSWQGWLELLPLLKEVFEKNQTSEAYSSVVCSPTRILDLGCGNGRFLSFLLDHLSSYHCEYHGVDLSQKLLEKAEKIPIPASYKRALTQTDIVVSLLEKKQLAQSKHYDIVCLFGVLHHIPSAVLRQQLLLQALALTKPGGLLISTFWQFGFDTKQTTQPIAPLQRNQQRQPGEEVFERNDYLLPWQNQTGKRYAHHFSDEEISSVVENLPGAKLLARYTADGKNQQNHYIVLKKNDDGV